MRLVAFFPRPTGPPGPPLPGHGGGWAARRPPPTASAAAAAAAPPILALTLHKSEPAELLAFVRLVGHRSPAAPCPLRWGSGSCSASSLRCSRSSSSCVSVQEDLGAEANALCQLYGLSAAPPLHLEARKSPQKKGMNACRGNLRASSPGAPRAGEAALHLPPHLRAPGSTRAAPRRAMAAREKLQPLLDSV